MIAETMRSVIGNDLNEAGNTVPTALNNIAPVPKANKAKKTRPSSHMPKSGLSPLKGRKYGTTTKSASVNADTITSLPAPKTENPRSIAKKKSTNVVSMAKNGAPVSEVACF